MDPWSVFREATWEEAMSRAAGGLAHIRDTHGGGALSGFGSAKGSNEEAYLFQKLVRQGFGTNNVDHCTRLCHASSVAALMEGNRRATPIHVPKLLVRALLPTLLKTKCLEPCDDLRGLQHRQFAFRHVSAHLNRLRSDELRFQFRLTVLE
jgi:NADH dehydrogenase/NADH:ubiquinone oxidoreductase subunit G